MIVKGCFFNHCYLVVEQYNNGMLNIFDKYSYKTQKDGVLPNNRDTCFMSS